MQDCPIGAVANNGTTEGRKGYRNFWMILLTISDRRKTTIVLMIGVGKPERYQV